MVTYRQLLDGIKIGLDEKQIREKHSITGDQYRQMTSRLRLHRQLQQLEQLRVILCESTEGRAAVTLFSCMENYLVNKARKQTFVSPFATTLRSVADDS